MLERRSYHEPIRTPTNFTACPIGRKTRLAAGGDPGPGRGTETGIARADERPGGRAPGPGAIGHTGRLSYRRDPGQGHHRLPGPASDPTRHFSLAG